VGVLRLFLALSVVSGHAASNAFGLPPVPAFFAVNFFFIISGFYMAMVLNEKYVDRSTLGAFYKNRVLRLFPVYFVGLLIGIVVALPAIMEFFSTLTAWGKVFFVAVNALIVGQDLSYIVCIPTVDGGCAYPTALTINPPAWSLAVELGFYLIAPFIVRSPRRTFLFVMVGAVYLLAISFLVFPTPDLGVIPQQNLTAFNYYFYPSSFLFFGLGALSYQLSKGIAKPHWWAGVLLFVVLIPTTTNMPFWQPLVFALAIPVLFAYTKRNRTDRLIGELSYPVYILHFPILVGFRAFAEDHPRVLEILPLGTWVGAICVVLGIALHFTVERVSKRFRSTPVTIGAVTTTGAATTTAAATPPGTAAPSGAPNSASGTSTIPGGAGVQTEVRTDLQTHTETDDEVDVERTAPARARSAVVRRVIAAVLVLGVVVVPFTTVGTAAIAQAELAKIPSATPVDLTDDNWQSGVGREFAGFFVPKTDVNLAHFAPGRTVTFANGEQRQIEHVETIDVFLQVMLKGGPLDGIDVGYPNEFTVGR
jgi:peptidoglycan/LPS O-acetylase OafA/YrhL